MLDKKSEGATGIDPVTFEVLRSHFDFCTQRMSKVLQKTAFSPILSDILDFSNAVYDPEARLVAQAPGCPIHMAAMHYSAEAALRRYPIETLKPGDVVVLNDPYEGGTHIPDMTFTMPIFFEGELMGLAMNRGHWQDLGGGAAGGQSFGTHVASEGLRVPPLKIYSEYVLNEDLLRIFEKNTRCPEYIEGDIQAHMGALKVAEQEYIRAAERYGRETVQIAMRELIAYTERVSRHYISQIPDGVYEVEDYLDTDGIAVDRLKVVLKMTVDGDRLSVDLTGSDPQCEGAVNSPLANTFSAVYLALRFYLCPDAPANAGLFNAVDITLPEGCWLNAEWPAPTIGCTNVTASKIAAAVWQAMGKAAPERTAAPPGADANWFVCTVTEPKSGAKSVFSDVPSCGWGGTPDHDGDSGLFDPTGNCMNLPAETAELLFPVVYEEFEFKTDTAGAGHHRGGLGIRQKIRFLGDAEFSIACSRTLFASPGANGGKAPTFQYLRHETPDGKVETIGGFDENGDWHRPLVSGHRFRAGDAMIFEACGGAGWGDPLSRPQASVLEDVKNDYISIEAANQDYGVAIDPQSMTVDDEATRALRNG